jgi:transposase
MSTLAALAPHLTVDELFERYRSCTNAVEKTHWQILWWRAQGRRTGEVADLTGFKPDWIRRLVRRYNEGGPDAVLDGRANNGAEPMLDLGKQEELLSLLMGPAPDGGLWNGPKVARWMAEQLGHKVHPQRGWDYLQRLGLSTQSPRPRHLDADAAAQEEFKKNSTRSLPKSSARTRTPRSSSGAKTRRASG